ncbi:hypothetical protein KAH55_03805 [bacterium]|nr:hypothetical protein [bacterium]
MNQSASHLHFQQIEGHQIAVFDGEECIFRVEDGAVTFLRLRPNGQTVLGREVPMPLYWWQYANHEASEQNCSSRIELTVLSEANDMIRFTCTGENASGQVKSIYRVSVARSQNAYFFEIEAELFIAAAGSWLVTPNSSHGELEFCNFWPKGSFSTQTNSEKKYQTCLVQRGDDILSVPHHHLETSDKNNILLQCGDKLAWVLEEDNPVIEILSEDMVEAGICAYMWDVHFGYKICTAGQPVTLEGPRQFVVKFLLSGWPRLPAANWLANARCILGDFVDNVPVWCPGDSCFVRTMADYLDGQTSIWPWQFSGGHPAAAGRLERNTGPGWRHVLQINHPVAADSIWQFTALGSAFGQPAFPNKARYRLGVRFSTESAQGNISVSLRLHRAGQGSVFDLKNYATFTRSQTCADTEYWTALTVETPLVSPAPDRIHLLLEFSGKGRCRFTDVRFVMERL